MQQTNSPRKLNFLLVITVFTCCLSVWVCCQVKQITDAATGYEGETE